MPLTLSLVGWSRSSVGSPLEQGEVRRVVRVSGGTADQPVVVTQAREISGVFLKMLGDDFQ